MAEDTPTPRRGRGRPTNEEIAAELGSVTQFAATGATGPGTTRGFPLASTMNRGMAQGLAS